MNVQNELTNYQKYKQSIIESVIKYQQANKERTNQISRNYYQRNKDRIRENKLKKYNTDEKCREKLR